MLNFAFVAIAFVVAKESVRTFVPVFTAEITVPAAMPVPVIGSPTYAPVVEDTVSVVAPNTAAAEVVTEAAAPSNEFP